MRRFKVIALSVGAKDRILESGEMVSENAFEESEVDYLITEGFIEEVKVKSETPKKEEAKKESKAGKKSLGKKLLDSIKA